MVTQRNANQPQQELPPEPESLDDFKIVDSTPSEQLEIEAELDAELDQPEAAQAAEVDGEEVPLGRDTEREASPGPVAQAPIEPEQQEQEPQAEAQPQVRQYSQDEVSKMQAAWMRQIQEAQRKERAAQDAHDLEAAVETRLRRQERELTSQYGEEEARKLVRSPQNEQDIREREQVKQENQRLQQQIQQRDQTEEQQAKTIVAQRMMDAYGLQTNDYDLLLNTTSPDGMQALAQRLSDQTLQKRQQEEARRAKVPAETRRTQLENGASAGAAPLSHEQMLTRTRQKASWEWTPKEREFMRTGRL